MKNTLFIFAIISLFINQSIAQTSAVQNIQWKYCTAKYDCDIQSPQGDLSGNVTFRMQKDSIVWFSVSAIMGIQILKGIITKDSAHVLDVYNQKYYPLSLSDLSSMQELPADLSAIQALIVGNSPTNALIQYDSTKPNEYIGATPPYLSFGLTTTNNLVSSSRFSDKGKMKKLKISYLERITNKEVALPNQMEWEIQDMKSDLNSLRLKLSLKTARFDSIPSYPFSVPNDYERVSIQKN
jgi:hypothetical protein